MDKRWSFLGERGVGFGHRTEVVLAECLDRFYIVVVDNTLEFGNNPLWIIFVDCNNDSTPQSYKVNAFCFVTNAK